MYTAILRVAQNYHQTVHFRHRITTRKGGNSINNTTRIYGEDINGNVKAYFVIDEDKEELIVSQKRTDKQLKYLNDKDELRRHNNKLGGFVNVMFINNELLFNNILNPQDTFRFIYLSTHLDYDNNLLVKNGLCNEKFPMNKNDIYFKMKLSKRAFNCFWDNLIQNECIYEVENKVYINPNYFIKGKSDKSNNKQFSRIYVDTIQVLYEGATSRSHKNLGYIMKLLPKMNYKTNFIVHNPDEDNVFNLQPYSLIEICKELNMSTDKSNMRKFYKSLNETTVKLDDNEYKIFSKILVDDKYDFYLINPLIAYKGKYISDIHDMLRLLVKPMNENK